MPILQKPFHRQAVMSLMAALVLWVGVAAGAEQENAVKQETPALIDDFRNPEGQAPSGAAWRLFTDRVMGGISRADAMHVDEGEHRFMRMVGMVSLANNGGFIQVALPLADQSAPLDASAYDGIRLEIKTEDEGYAIHLRTSDCNRPWEHYKAEIPPGEGWRTVDLPFADFAAYSLNIPLNSAELVRLGVVAGSREFVADISVSRIEFYRQSP